MKISKHNHNLWRLKTEKYVILKCRTVIFFTETGKLPDAVAYSQLEIFFEGKNIGGGAKCLILYEQHYFVWNNSSNCY